MLEVSCNSNGHRVIGYNGDCVHVNTLNVNYYDDKSQTPITKNFGKYGEAAHPICNFRRPPYLQSTPEPKEQVHDTTYKEGQITTIQNANSCRNLTCDKENYSASCAVSGISKNFLDCSPDTFESLDVQAPLLDYLVRHHAISGESSLEIIRAEKCERPFLLLSAIGLPIHNGGFRSSGSSNSCPFAPPQGLALLLNALRQTGHHELASYLDYSRRINPSPSICNGMSLGYSELPAKRRRGQISLWVQLLAIKVSPSFYTQLTEQNLKNKDVNTPVLPSHVQKLQENNTTFNFSGTENCQFENSCRLPSSPVWIDHTTIFKSTVDTKQSNTDDVKPKERAVKRARSHWGKLLLPFTCCFKVSKKAPSSPKTQSRNSIDNPSNANQINNETICNTNSQCNLPTETPRIPIVNCKSDQDTRTASRAILDTKSLEFYNAILENSSTLHDAVVKYLEQSSGVLVLDYKLGHFSRTSASVHSTSESVPALCIVLVATQSEIIRRLSEDCNLHSSIIEPTSKETDRSLQSDEVKTIPDKLMLTSKLADDLATVLIRAGVLQQLELQNLRLLTTLDPKEVEIAIKELLDMEE